MRQAATQTPPRSAAEARASSGAAERTPSSLLQSCSRPPGHALPPPPVGLAVVVVAPNGVAALQPPDHVTDAALWKLRDELVHLRRRRLLQPLEVLLQELDAQARPMAGRRQNPHGV
eukprot:8301167-Pyramimonas_sp.AAC.2